MQRGMARRSESHRSASQFGSSTYVVVELGCGREGKVLEKANLRWSRFLAVQDLCGLLPINFIRLAMRCPAALRVNMQLYFSFMTPLLATICGDALLVATRTRTVTAYIGLRAEPMTAPSKIAMQRAGRVGRVVR